MGTEQVFIWVCSFDLAGSRAPLMLDIQITAWLEFGSGFGRNSLEFYSMVPGWWSSIARTLTPTLWWLRYQDKLLGNFESALKAEHISHVSLNFPSKHCSQNTHVSFCIPATLFSLFDLMEDCLNGIHTHFILSPCIWLFHASFWFSSLGSLAERHVCAFLPEVFWWLSFTLVG